jgi:hypothetical protein
MYRVSKVLLIGGISVVSAMVTAWADPTPPETSHLQLAIPEMHAPLESSWQTVRVSDAHLQAIPASEDRVHTLREVSNWDGTAPCEPLAI